MMTCQQEYYQTKHLFKPFELSKKFQENPQIDQAFIDRISQKVKDNLLLWKQG